MQNTKDLTNMTLEELKSEEKRLKNNEIYAALASGFLLGVMVFGIVRNGFGFLYVFIPLGMIFYLGRESRTRKQKLAEVRTAIKNKELKL